MNTRKGEAYVYRRRVCACGNKWTTYEVHESVYDVLRALQKLLPSMLESVPEPEPEPDSAFKLEQGSPVTRTLMPYAGKYGDD